MLGHGLAMCRSIQEQQCLHVAWRCDRFSLEVPCLHDLQQCQSALEVHVKVCVALQKWQYNSVLNA